MSTPSVRQDIKTEVETKLAPLKVFNLSDYLSISDLPLNTTDQCVLLDFIAANDMMTTIGGEGNQGWRESGTVGVHWLVPAGFDYAPVLAAAENFRLGLRGTRLGKIVIETVEPFMDSGSPIDINGPWQAFSAILYYERHDCG